MSTISVIIPFFNSEKTLPRCIESIIDQTFLDYELILVDDGSTDNSLSICNNYAKNDNRVIIIKKDNGGPASARNYGLDFVFSHSESECIAFVDSDDYIDKNYLFTLYKEMKIHNSDIVACNIFIKSDQNSNLIIQKDETFKLIDFFERRYSDFPNKYLNMVWGKLFKKSIINTIRFPLRSSEDEYFANAIYQQDGVITTVSKTTYHYVNNSESIVNNPTFQLFFDGLDALIERYCIIRFKQKNVKTSLCMLDYIYKQLLLMKNVIFGHKKEYKRTVCKTIKVIKNDSIASLKIKIRLLFLLFYF